jgi:hypothetical protein
MSDVFAFGVVLFEIMAGEEPWTGTWTTCVMCVLLVCVRGAHMAR